MLRIVAVFGPVLAGVLIAVLAWPGESIDLPGRTEMTGADEAASGYEIAGDGGDLVERASVGSENGGAPAIAADATEEPGSTNARIAEARERFAQYWDGFRSEFYTQMEANRDGDRYLRTSRKYWGNFHPAFIPSEEMTADLSQVEKYAVLKILKVAGKTLPGTQDKFGASLATEEALALNEGLRDRSLFHSPELTIELVLGPDSGWAEDEVFVSEARAIWKDMLLLLAPVENEAWAIERCALKAWGGASRDFSGSVDLSLIAPDLAVAVDTRTALCREFYDRLIDLAEDYRE